MPKRDLCEDYKYYTRAQNASGFLLLSENAPYFSNSSTVKLLACIRGAGRRVMRPVRMRRTR